ncbi:hypothetical protein K7432_007060 [Basidiobolus ranarum]|uniref:threonine--tRNA ligase n=1 Tax=Basidiobolus ranarum TaxID=34480 RepID=A0ABR2W0X0_9FUNG
MQATVTKPQWLRYAQNSSKVSRRFISTKYLQHRVNLWNIEKKKQEELTRELFGNKKVEISLPDGSVKCVEAGVTTPFDIASGISRSLAKDAVIAKVNESTLWDMSRPLVDNCSLQICKYDPQDESIHDTFWHSSAHLLGSALEAKYGDNILLCDGPSLKDRGFFYEFLLLKNSSLLDQQVSNSKSNRDKVRELLQSDDVEYLGEQNLPEIVKFMNKGMSQKSPFERLVVDRSFANKLFEANPFKLHYINNVPEDSPITLYKCGDFIDLCRGPHVAHTGQIRAFDLLKTASAHWLPEMSESNIPQALNRIYGISFQNAQGLKAWKDTVEEAKKRDHRVIGKAQNLFTFHPWSPGSTFMLPHGTRIAHKLANYIRQEYNKFGYDEVMSPLIYKKELWETSGHWENYKEDMFVVQGGADEATNSGHSCCGDADGEDVFGLKPMNCPGHCLIFDSTTRSYRDLPIRLADFSPLHRNEASGALSGLTRVRKFHQDDAHIFCADSQIFSEISNTLSFVERVYSIFKFPHYDYTLSTRPSNYIGEVAEWDRAEEALKKALNDTGRPWTIKEGDGAFYGPKIDIMVRDALQRVHQTATIQLDFQLPRRFNLHYHGEDEKIHTPVIIHRAILGSIERMMAILIEHTSGKWPFWLSPRQAMLCPVGGPESVEYAKAVKAKLADPTPDNHFYIDVNTSKNTLNKMVREAQLSQYNFILVVGEKERNENTVTVRARDGKILGVKTIEEVQEMFHSLNLNFD